MERILQAARRAYGLTTLGCALANPIMASRDVCELLEYPALWWEMIFTATLVPFQRPVSPKVVYSSE